MWTESQRQEVLRDRHTACLSLQKHQMKAPQPHSTDVVSIFLQGVYGDNMNARSVAGRLVFALFQWKRLVILFCVGKKTPIFTEPCCFPAITHPCVPLPYALLGRDCIEGGSPPGHGCLHWRDPQNGISQKIGGKETHFHKFNTHCPMSQKTVHRDAPPCAAPCATALLSCA